MALDWSTRKQIQWLSSIGGIIFVAVGITVYVLFFNHPASCFDGKENQNERGVDCGGSCLRVCAEDARSLVSIWSRSFEIAPGTWSGVAYLENQNVIAGAREVAYEFRVYDENNLLITTPMVGKTFIDPNARTAIVSPGISVGNRIPTTTFFRITSIPEWEKAPQRFSVPQVVTKAIRIEDESSMPKVFAQLENTSFNDLRMIEVVAIVYDQKGNALSASKTLVDSLPRQSTTDLFFTWQAPFSAKVYKVELIPRVNPFVQQ